MDRQTRHEIAHLLNKLADGESVALGEFGDHSLTPTRADAQAEGLREIAEDLRSFLTLPDRE